MVVPDIFKMEIVNILLHYHWQVLCLFQEKGPRADRAMYIDEQKQYTELSTCSSTSKSGAPAPSTMTNITTVSTSDITPCQRSIAPLGEQQQIDVSVHELPTLDSVSENESTDRLLANISLLPHIEVLEAENAQLISQKSKKLYFQIEDVKNDDKLVRFYTGFISYAVILSSFEFLGPAVHHLNFWGSNESSV